MSRISAQVSLYPLRQKEIDPAIREAVRALSTQGLSTRTGEMSTLVWGEDPRVFAALREAFDQAAAHGEVVMVVTLSNACSLPEAS